MIEDDGVADGQLGDDASVTSLEGSSMGMDEKAEFDAFTKRHRKKYKDSGEYKKRFSVWRDNLSFVRKWNSDESRNFEVGMNEMADLTDEEFAASYLNQDLHNEYLQSETFTGQETLLQESAGVDDMDKESASEK